MSWNRSFSNKANFYANIPTFATLDDSLEKKETVEQITIAREVAARLIESGAIGMGKDYGINISGHANPGHEKRDGWANDCITISIHQLNP